MKKNKVSFIFAAPAWIVYTVLLIIPILMAFVFSFFKWNGISTMKFAGLGNYIRIFQDARLGNALENTLIVASVVVVFVNAGGLFVAILLNKSTWFSNLCRTAYFIPVIMSTVAVSFVWKSILAYNGVLNSILQSIGLENIIINSMSSRGSALTCVCLVEIWKNFGYYMMIYVAALQTVPAELYEACIVDGGNAWDQFRNVTLPMIIPGASVSVIMSIINELKIYDVIKVMTDGGPGYDTETIVYNIVAQGFSNSRVGYSSAISILLFIVTAAISAFIMRKSNQAGGDLQ